MCRWASSCSPPIASRNPATARNASAMATCSGWCGRTSQPDMDTSQALAVPRRSSPTSAGMPAGSGGRNVPIAHTRVNM
ncbi:hypothetical protein ACU686_17440 [Yinghuangia aomiensis]